MCDHPTGSQEPTCGAPEPRPPLLQCPDASGSTGRLRGPSPIRAAYFAWSKGEGPEAMRAAYDEALKRTPRFMGIPSGSLKTDDVAPMVVWDHALRNRRRIAAERLRRLLMGAVLIAIGMNCRFMPRAMAQESGPTAPERMAAERVIRVVDGDTVVLNRGGKLVTCRLYGVNTPETVAPGLPVQPGGPEASAYLKAWLEGKTVRVSYEGEEATRDRYGRPLVYLWADYGRQLVNLELIGRGYGRFDRQYKTKYRQFFDVAEQEAKDKHVGIWGHDGG